MMKKLVSRKWLFTTILVLAGSAVCVRLGIWQLDRLEQRRKFNAHVEAMWAAAPLKLPKDSELALGGMEYRSICVQGRLDFDNQIALRNQYWRDQYGYHLLTPMIMESDEAVLIDRGWIPASDSDGRSEWRIYDEDAEQICGIIRLGSEKPDVGGRPDPTLAPGQSELRVWNNVNLVRLAAQMPYPLLRVYVQQNENESDDVPPVPFQPEIELSEGPHLGYAGQWFTFASILFFGYPFYVRQREKQDD